MKTCTDPGCDSPHRARGLCTKHWKRKYGTRTRYRINCAWCDKAHETPRENGRFCSVACVMAMKAYDAGNNVCGLSSDHPARRLQFLRKNWPSVRVFFRTCAVCSALFATPYTVSTCGKTCAETKRRDDKRERRHRRRAAERNAFVAKVIPSQVFERDRWRCHICGKATRRTAVVPHPSAPTIDHLIPLAEGGTHEPANVRTAHFRCNTIKGARGGNEQLMLIG
jgi:5-methylcytosine-specific restriction endonuclease McrA